MWIWDSNVNHPFKKKILAVDNLINSVFPGADRYTKYIAGESNFVDDLRSAS